MFTRPEHKHAVYGELKKINSNLINFYLKGETKTPHMTAHLLHNTVILHFSKALNKMRPFIIICKVITLGHSPAAYDDC